MFKILTLFVCLASLYSCVGNTDIIEENHGVTKVDSIRIKNLKTLVLDHYDLPVEMTKDEIENKEFDKKLIFKNREARWKREREFAFDSVMAKFLDIAELPIYQPSQIEYNSINEPIRRIRIVIDKRVFGREDIEIIDLFSRDLLCVLTHAKLQLSNECGYVIGDKELDVSCFKSIYRNTYNVDIEWFLSILESYYEHDVGRIAYYNHQSHLLCDGFSYYIRYISSDKDNRTAVDCPGEKSSVLEFIRELKNKIGKLN